MVNGPGIVAGREGRVVQDPRVPISLRRPGGPQSPAAIADAQSRNLAQKYGLQPPGSPGSSEQRVLVITDLPDSQQPTISTARNMWANLNPDQLKQVAGVMDRFYGKGRWSISGGAGKAGIEGFWNKAIDVSLSARALNRRVYVMDAFENVLKNAEELGLAPGGRSGGGGGAPRITETVNLTDPGTAQLLVDQALEQYLGRKASEAELKQFRRSLARAERGSPTRIDIEGSRQTTSGGFNPAAFAQQFARGQEGAAEYQVATTFLDEFMNALGPRVEL